MKSKEEQIFIHNFSINDELELEVYAEICCDLCDDVIHNHIDCPVCNKSYAETNQYCDLYDEKELICENCKTVFERISDSWYSDCHVKIKYLKL